MRTRKLIKDPSTQKQNIVWFGSYGYIPNATSFEMTLDLHDDVNNKEYNYRNINPYFTKDDSNNPDITKIKITPTNSLTDYICIISCNYFLKNKNFTFEKSYEFTGEEDFLLKDIIDEIGEYDMIYSFMLLISSKIDNEIFTIQYNEKSSKLAYDKNKINEVLGANYYIKSQNFNYSLNQESVKNGLIPKLSIIKGELWYFASYGLPLTEKVKSKGIYDSIIINIITSYPDVVNIEDFNSYIENNTYIYSSNINTIYNKSITISNK